MAASLVDQYRRILAADPRSRIFVDLARSLLADGDAAGAAEACRRGLEHHPDSVQGRVLLGRALLAMGDVAAALAEFEAAAAIEPGNPYALNLACEALVDRGLGGRAGPMLERAAALQPGNARIRSWLEAARLEPAAPEPPQPASDPEPALPPASDGAAGERRDGAGEAQALASAVAIAAAGAAAEAAPSPAPDGAAGAPPVAHTPPPIRRAPPPVPLPAPGTVAPLPPANGILGELPGGAPAGPPPPKPRAPHAAEAERIAVTYEHELRAELMASVPPARDVPRRQFLLLAGVTTAVLAVVGGLATYFAVRHAHRVEDARELVERARRGILRDTGGSLREASRALAEARTLDPDSALARSLSALAAGLRWADHRDFEARTLAQSLVASGQAADAAPAVRYLLAEAEADRADAGSALAGSGATPAGAAEAVAARALLERGDAAGATARLEASARATPPSVRSLAALGDLALARGEPEEALTWLAAALSAHPTHPGAATASAEARLALHRDLGEALATLRAVEADAGSPPPLSLRLRFELAMARLLAADGQRAAALDRLSAAEGKVGPTWEVPLARAELELASGACERAEPEARRAVAAGAAVPGRLLLARAQACRGRYRELLRSSEGQTARELRVARAEAFLAVGDPHSALAELEATGQDGRMPADAAARYALALDALGKRAQAQAVLDRLLAMKKPPAPAFLAAAQVAERAGRPDDALHHYLSAVEADDELLEGHCGLGRLLLARGRPADAALELARASVLAPSHLEARVALGRARLATGDARGAREAFAAAVSFAPRSGAALRGLADAELADGNPAEARRDVDRALRSDPGSWETWLTAARVALAQGDHRSAVRFAERAKRLAGKGEAGAEAQRLLELARHSHG